ncbi:MAG: AraC family transcriptional regulator [Terrimicrobiaceae bacterium]|nr:AraC family transcriptional regulator [Terrimicrobiaceae bacterium]
MNDLPRAEFGVDEETVQDASYHWDNRRRNGMRPIQVAQFVWAGEGVIEHRGEERMARAGDMMIFSLPDETSYRHPGSPSGPWTFSWVNFTGFETVWEGLRADHGALVRLGPGSRAGRMLRRLAGHVRNGVFSDPWAASQAAYQFVMQLGREAAEVGPEMETRLARARAFLLQETSGATGVKEVAARFGYSREHFSRLFAERYGETPGELLRRARLRRARALLGQSGFSLERIAALSGFGSAAALCRAFREKTGEAPGAWRERVRGRPVPPA